MLTHGNIWTSGSRPISGWWQTCDRPSPAVSFLDVGERKLKDNEINQLNKVEIDHLNKGDLTFMIFQGM